MTITRLIDFYAEVEHLAPRFFRYEKSFTGFKREFMLSLLFFTIKL
jgi:hypothetical protein